MQVYNKYIRRLKRICLFRGIPLEEIGKVGRKRKFPLYKIILNPAAKITVCFSAGIHGEEISGPLAVLKFLKKYKWSSFNNVRIIIFPVVNPTGFNSRKRLNYRGINLNQSFFSRPIPKEDRIVYDEIKKENIFFFHSLHEDSDEESTYLYCFEKKPEKIYRKITYLQKKFFKLKKGIDDDGTPIINGQLINKFDKSFESKLFQRRKTKYAVCTETPMKKILKKRIALNIRIMNLILDFADKK